MCPKSGVAFARPTRTTGPASRKRRPPRAEPDVRAPRATAAAAASSISKGIRSFRLMGTAEGRRSRRLLPGLPRGGSGAATWRDRDRTARLDLRGHGQSGSGFAASRGKLTIRDPVSHQRSTTRANPEEKSAKSGLGCNVRALSGARLAAGPRAEDCATRGMRWPPGADDSGYDCGAAAINERWIWVGTPFPNVAGIISSDFPGQWWLVRGGEAGPLETPRSFARSDRSTRCDGGEGRDRQRAGSGARETALVETATEEGFGVPLTAAPSIRLRRRGAENR